MCTVSGADITCEPEVSVTTISERLESTRSATWTGTCTERSMCTFVQENTQSCEGADCEAAAINDDRPYPCTSTLSILYQRD